MPALFDSSIQTTVLRPLYRTILTVVVVTSVLACSGGGGGTPALVAPPPQTVDVVAISPSTLTLVAGQTGTFGAEARDARGSPIAGKTFTWTSSNAPVATVNSAGVVTALAPGTATIAASVDGKTGTAQLTVTPGPVATVTVAPALSAVAVGGTVQLLASVKDASGFAITNRPVTWTSASPSIASVTASGLVTAHATGQTTITAATDGKSGSATIQVSGTIGLLEIHQINVGWGGAVLVRGPNGTTVLLEAGENGDGVGEVVPYLKSIGIQPVDGLSYTIAGHQHCDHLGGLDEVVQQGYDIKIKNFYNGSTTTSTCVTDWANATRSTTAGIHVAPAVGTVVPLGNGATLRVIAVNGQLIGGGSVAVSDENDRSIGVLVQYGGFEYIWASDLGGGEEDKSCTGRDTNQRNVESALIKAISPGGASPLISAGGIDVVHVNHHGSESSMNSEYMNLTRPAVALIGTGAGQGSNFHHPRKDVVEKVLLAQGPCVTVPPALVLQSEEGSPIGTQTSFAGFTVGDIVISTNGTTTFTVSANGVVTQGPNEALAAGLPRTIALDDVPSVLAARERQRRLSR